MRIYVGPKNKLPGSDNGGDPITLPWMIQAPELTNMGFYFRAPDSAPAPGALIQDTKSLKDWQVGGGVVSSFTDVAGRPGIIASAGPTLRMSTGMALDWEFTAMILARSLPDMSGEWWPIRIAKSDNSTVLKLAIGAELGIIEAANGYSSAVGMPTSGVFGNSELSLNIVRWRSGGHLEWWYNGELLVDNTNGGGASLPNTFSGSTLSICDSYPGDGNAAGTGLVEFAWWGHAIANEDIAYYTQRAIPNLS